MSKYFYTLILLFLFIHGFSQENYTISGYVQDDESGEALLRAMKFPFKN